MFRAARLLPALCMAATFGLTAQTPNYHSETPSTWILSTSESDFGGTPAPKSDVFTITKDTDAWIAFKDTIVNADGSKMVMSYSHKPDGKLYPLVGGGGAKAAFTNDGKTRWVLPDGSDFDLQIAFSDDRKTVTQEGEFRGKDGKTAHIKMVYHRTK